MTYRMGSLGEDHNMYNMNGANNVLGSLELGLMSELACVEVQVLCFWTLGTTVVYYTTCLGQASSWFTLHAKTIVKYLHRLYRPPQARIQK